MKLYRLRVLHIRARITEFRIKRMMTNVFYDVPDTINGQHEELTSDDYKWSGGIGLPFLRFNDRLSRFRCTLPIYEYDFSRIHVYCKEEIQTRTIRIRSDMESGVRTVDDKTFTILFQKDVSPLKGLAQLWFQTRDFESPGSGHINNHVSLFSSYPIL